MTEGRRAYTVSEIAGSVRRTLEERFGRTVVRGEISNFKQAASRHLYFTLKDDRAQLRVVMFRGSAVGLRFLPADGLEVEVDGEVTLYEPRGDLQLIARHMVPAGVGALMQAYERLKRKLQEEGLFASERKRSLPRFPGTVAVVTSPTGAAVRDLLHVLGRRWPPARVVLVPVRVQGSEAAGEIAAALARVNRWGEADVVIVGRGGGSLEDLWAFNEETVARAIAASETPVISAVGHESDVTIADFAADVRAATPSAAAEIAVPDRREIEARMGHVAARLEDRAHGLLRRRRRALESLAGAYGLRRPERFLQREQQRVDRVVVRLHRLAAEMPAAGRRRMMRLEASLRACHPRTRIALGSERLRRLEGGLARASAALLADARGRLVGSRRALDALDPTRVLDRGYCVARLGRRGPLVDAAGDLEPGREITVQFSRDRARATVAAVEAGRLPEIFPVLEETDES